MIARVRLPGGTAVAVLGQGTWHMGERGSDVKAEALALRAGLDLGLTLIDTAEMYAEGGAEQVVAQAVAGRREEVFLVSKVYPHNASRKGCIAACERSLTRLNTDRIDLYLLHWRGSVPLAQTIAGMEALLAAGKIRSWGVSNFDIDDLEELWAAGGNACATNQVLYNPEHRGIEFDLLAWQTAHSMPVMGYTPLGQAGRLLRTGALATVAARHGATPAQVALAWAIRSGSVIAIPKASTIEHVKANAAAAALRLEAQDLAAIDAAFPPPRRKKALAML